MTPKIEQIIFTDTDTTDEANILAEDVTVKTEKETVVKKSPRRSSFFVESTQAIKTNTSVLEISANDDSFVIPETQIFSQDDVEPSIISLSSDEETRIEQTEDKDTTNANDSFALGENTDNVKSVAEASTALITEENGKQ